MNVRRMNIFFFCDRCNAMHTFYSFARLYHLSSRNHFCHRTRRVLRAQHLITSCPTPTANRGRHGRSADHYYTSSPHPDLKPRQRHAHSAGYYISHAPAESRSAGCGARRKTVRLSGRRHGVTPWASVKLPLRPVCPSKARACPWWSTSWAKVRQAPAYPRASICNRVFY